jgi:hypothetical protein
VGSDLCIRDRYLALLTAITIAATFFTPETIGRDLNDTRDAIDDPATVPMGGRAGQPI